MRGHVVVIGGGIVGVSTGIWLRRMGAEVTLVDKSAPGQGTSFGNAGLLAACAMVPVTTPGLIAKGPKYLADPQFPLFLRWSYLPRLLPWLARYLAHANDADTTRIARALTPLVADSVAQHDALTDGLSARGFLCKSDYNFAYPGRSAFEASAYEWRLRRQAGFVPELIEGGAIREYDPAFGPAVGLLARLQDHGYVLDPGGYVTALAADFEALGGKVVQAAVTDIALEGGTLRQVLTDRGPLPCDRAVLAAGVWSGPLMKKLGLRVPLESERGYHIVFEKAQGGPRAPVMVSAGKFVATPMSAGLRCAGVVEFGGLAAGPSKAPLALLRRKMAEAFPGATWQGEESWMGHRPATPDSLPLIGEVGRTGVYAAFGHQHVGLTAGPKTGRLVAGLATGQPPNLDLAPYDPRRFGQ